MNTALVWLHGLLGFALCIGTLATAWRAGTPLARRASMVAGLAAIVLLGWGASRVRAWEPSYRRAVYLASHSAGNWLDRKMHFGVAACCFALAAMFTSLDRNAPPWLLRLLAALSFAFAMLAWIALAYVRARVPNATLD